MMYSIFNKSQDKCGGGLTGLHDSHGLHITQSYLASDLTSLFKTGASFTSAFDTGAALAFS